MIARKLKPKVATGSEEVVEDIDGCFDLDSDAAFRKSYQGRALRESMASSAVGATGTTKMSERNTFLGVIDKRYVRSFTGLLHAAASVLALITGNYLFVRVIVLNHSYDDGHIDSTATVFHLSTFLSGVTLLPFWHKVQSWQLSTTTMAQKGLSSNQMQQFNQGRGVLAPILSAFYPLLYRYLLQQQLRNEQAFILDNTTLSRLIGASVLLVALYQYTLIRGYGKALFIVYGGSKLGFSLHLLYSGSLASLGDRYPYAVEYLEKEALLVTCCVEFGFLWYYLYSRRLVAKEFVQTMCKNYHPALLYIWVARLTLDRWWSRLPWSLSWVMALNSLLTALFLSKLLKSLVGPPDNQAPKQKEKEEAKQSRRLGARSSIFEVQSSRTGMRSSVFESITVASRFERIEEKGRKD